MSLSRLHTHAHIHIPTHTPIHTHTHLSHWARVHAYTHPAWQAFSAVGAVEGCSSIAANYTWTESSTGAALGFSEEEIVSCLTYKGKADQGCDGGEITDAFDFVAKYGLVRVT